MKSAIVMLRCTMDEIPLRVFIGDDSRERATSFARNATKGQLGDLVLLAETVLNVDATKWVCLAVYEFTDTGVLLGVETIKEYT